MRWLILLSVLLTAAKLTEITAAAAAMSWWFVLAPVWIPVLIILLLALIAAKA